MPNPTIRDPAVMAAIAEELEGDDRPGHPIGGPEHTASTLAELNAKISDAELIGDGQLKASAADTTPGTLADKLVAGTGVSLALLNPGGDEKVEVSADPNAHEVVHPGGLFRVYVAGTTGDDTNDGSIGSPVQTLERALELAPNYLTDFGDLIHVLVVEANPANAPFVWPARAISRLRGSGSVHIEADSSLVTEVVAAQAITGYTDGYCTHTGTPFAANALEGRFREWLTGPYAAAGVFESIGANGVDFTRATLPYAFDDAFNLLAEPSSGDTYRVVTPLVPLTMSGANFVHLTCPRAIQCIPINFATGNVVMADGSFGLIMCAASFIGSSFVASGSPTVQLGGGTASALVEGSYGRLFGAGVRAGVSEFYTGRIIYGVLVSTNTSEAALRFRGSDYFLWWLTAVGAVSVIGGRLEVRSSHLRGVGRLQAGWNPASGPYERFWSGVIVMTGYSSGAWHVHEKANSGSADGAGVAYDDGRIVYAALRNGWTPAAPHSPYSVSRLTAGSSIEAKSGGRVLLDAADVAYLGRGGGATDFEVDDLGAGGSADRALFAAVGDALEGTLSKIQVVG